MADIINPLQRPIITGRPNTVQHKPPSTAVKTTGSFADILQKNLDQQAPKTLTLSKHAQVRASERNIEITETDMERLGEAVTQASGKGITDTLVFFNNTAFIVNVPSRVVVTMVDSSGNDDPTIFTNIDGAVIL